MTVVHVHVEVLVFITPTWSITQFGPARVSTALPHLRAAQHGLQRPLLSRRIQLPAHVRFVHSNELCFEGGFKGTL